MSRQGVWLRALVTALALWPTPSAKADTVITLDDFEKDTPTWTFVGGQEFPGAKGSLARDTSAAHGGKASCRIEADFSGGGAYVGGWRELTDLTARDVVEFRLWVKADNLSRMGVRVVDATGQCHQKNGGVPLAATAEWQHVVLKVKDLVGGEHWGGANDGKWHGPQKGFGLNLGKDGVDQAGQSSRLWIDDVVVSAVPPGVPTILAAVVSPKSCRPDYGSRITYRWDAEPMGKDYGAFVHFIGPDGKMAWQGDHEVPVPTSQWAGRVEYSITTAVPATAAPGDYRIVLGLYDRAAAARGWDRQTLKTGEGVKAVPSGGETNQYEVGVLKVAADAPLPKLPRPTLDLKGYKLTFNEDFKAPLSVSAWGPRTRWIAHTPYAGDFGDARFADPSPGFPFTIENGILRIEARKEGDRWAAGLLSSVDPKGDGFSQKFGYFEMRARFPRGPGTWPAFWLLGVPQLKEPKDKKTITQIEIDVVEQYGVMPHNLCTTVHLWRPDGTHWGKGDSFIVPDMIDGFHTYGVMIEDDFTTFYFDGVELRKDKTLPEAKVPLYLLVNLAMGSGWPIDKAPNPSFMYVDWVRAYSRGR